MNCDQTNESEKLIAAAIDAAEDIRDPLEGLVERTASDPGAPFAPDALERLAALKKDDRAAFEELRSELKKAGCRVTALDEAIAEESGGTGGRGPTQGDTIAAGSTKLGATSVTWAAGDSRIALSLPRMAGAAEDAVDATTTGTARFAASVHPLKKMIANITGKTVVLTAGGPGEPVGVTDPGI